jgi:shikimate kinase
MHRRSQRDSVTDRTPDVQQPDDPRHLVLVGLMGSGKSTVGRLLAARLDRPLVDTDDEVEQRAGRSVREIFDTDGEAAFRALESDVLADAVNADAPSVVAAAGGVVLSPVNRELLAGPRCRVVWLTAPARTLVDRTARGRHRPLLDEDPRGTLDTMAQEREALYREVADLVISVDGRTASDVADTVLR